MMTLTRSGLRDLYDALFDEPLPERFLFGVRGAVPSEQGGLTLVPKEGRLDLYDDAIGFMAGDRGHAYTGSVDPGRHFTEHPMPNTGGCAHVIEGHYTFVKGRHRSEPRAWCGRNVRCWRDRDRDGQRDRSDGEPVILKTSLNLHYGGRGNSIGEFSAGCQIVKRPQWETFRDLTYDLFPGEATYWLINIQSLIDFRPPPAAPAAPAAPARAPKVTVNDTLMERSVPMWISQEGKLVAIAREFLTRLRLDGRPVTARFEPGNPPSIVCGDRAVEGKIVQNRLVCPVADVIRALDPGVDVDWNGAEKHAVFRSPHLSLASLTPVALDAMPPGTNDNDAIPDS